MYIAFKWLVSLGLTMWLMMCLIGSFSKENSNICNTGNDRKPFDNYKNESVEIQLLPITPEMDIKDTLHSHYNRNHNMSGIHILMLITGAVAVTVFHKKQDAITFARQQMPTIHLVLLILILFCYLKIAATKCKVAIIQYSLNFREKIKIAILKVRNLKSIQNVKHKKINIILLKKLKEIVEERKHLGQLLISAIRENKNIRMRYELETMTKNRLIQHMEDTQKLVKENRSRYMSFQQLYLLTHQENGYLKARLGKLKKEKDEVDSNLMGLINKVYLSKNNDLKSYCTRFLVKTKDNLLNSDVNAEISMFLENSRQPSKIRVAPKSQLKDVKIPSCTSIQISEIINEDSIVPFTSDAPKLRGLPGEYVWTVRDKHGIIEKLYEYDFESDLDSGDTIRKIRQYSVYFDKNCLLDFARTEHGTNLSSSKILDNMVSDEKIVTGSEAFHNFLKSNNSIIQIKSTA